MAATYTQNGTNTPNGSHLIFTYTFPVLLSTDVKVALNGVTQATTKYAVDTAATKITFNNTSIDSTVQADGTGGTTAGAPLAGVLVRVYRETGVGKNTGDEHPKAVFASGSSIRASDLNNNFEQALFGIHELQERPFNSEDISDDAITYAKIQNVTATDRVLGRDTAGAGVVEEIAPAALRTMINVEDGATADQSNAEIRAAVEAATDSNVFTDADHTKLNAIEASATADQSNAEIRAAVEAASDSNVFTDADHTKLNGIAASANNYAISSDLLDEDDFATDSATKVPSQQSTKAYIGTYAQPKDADLTTLAGMQSGTASILASGTALTSTTAKLNLLSDKSIVTTISGTSTDVQLPTAKAVDDRVTTLVTDVGGFRPIANETSFPTTNPDPEDDAGTIVSVKALASNLTSNGSGVATIANGAGSGNTVTINGMANSDTIEAGKGILVETTSTLHTYTFHRETLAPADVTAAKSAVDDFNQRYQVAGSTPTQQPDGTALAEGDLFFDTAANKMKVYDGSNYGEVTSTGDYKYLFLCPDGGSGAPTLSNTSFDLREGSNSGSAASVTNAAQLIVSVNGVIQKANTGTSAPAEGFAMADANNIKFGAAPGVGSSIFIVQIGSAVSIPTPGDNTVSTIKIQNLAVTGGKIADDTITEGKLDVSNAPTNGQYLQAQSGEGGGLTWAAVSQYTTPLTTQGDILYRDGSGDQRLAKGTAGQALIMNSGATAPEWGAAGATIANDANNRIITADGSAGLNGEANLTFDGSTLALTGNQTATLTIQAQGYESPATVAANWSIGANNNAMFPGPMTVASGVTVTVPANRTLTVV